MEGVAVVAVVCMAVATVARAADDGTLPSARQRGQAPPWAFAITAYPTDVRGGQNFTSAIAAADHGSLHLEARFNYESIGARSAYVGWSFSGGDTLKWQLTPIVGGAWGTTHSFIPGFEASLAWHALDLYVEAEHVSTRSRDDSYTYAWSELGFRAVPWLRVGIAGQRTRTYANEREIQRGPFAQVTWGIVTIGGYWFNPGANDQVFVGSLGVKF